MFFKILVYGENVLKLYCNYSYMIENKPYFDKVPSDVEDIPLNSKHFSQSIFLPFWNATLAYSKNWKKVAFKFSWRIMTCLYWLRVNQPTQSCQSRVKAPSRDSQSPKISMARLHWFSPFFWGKMLHTFWNPCFLETLCLTENENSMIMYQSSFWWWMSLHF